MRTRPRASRRTAQLWSRRGRGGPHPLVPPRSSQRPHPRRTAAAGIPGAAAGRRRRGRPMVPPLPAGTLARPNLPRLEQWGRRLVDWRRRRDAPVRHEAGGGVPRPARVPPRLRVPPSPAAALHSRPPAVVIGWRLDPPTADRAADRPAVPP